MPFHWRFDAGLAGLTGGLAGGGGLACGLGDLAGLYGVFDTCLYFGLAGLEGFHALLIRIPENAYLIRKMTLYEGGVCHASILLPIKEEAEFFVEAAVRVGFNILMSLIYAHSIELVPEVVKSHKVFYRSFNSGKFAFYSSGSCCGGTQ